MKTTLAGAILITAVLCAVPAVASPSSPLATCGECPGQVCYGPQTLSWPDVHPVWQLSWLRACESSGTNASGIEIRDVSYNGHEVMKRGHIPMLNVQYVQ